MPVANDDTVPVSRSELRRIIQATTDYVGELTLYATATSLRQDQAVLQQQSETLKRAGDKLQSLIGPLEGVSDHAT